MTESKKLKLIKDETFDKSFTHKRRVDSITSVVNLEDLILEFVLLKSDGTILFTASSESATVNGSEIVKTDAENEVFQVLITREDTTLLSKQISRWQLRKTEGDLMKIFGRGVFQFLSV